jgi:putative flippase GtrA
MSDSTSTSRSKSLFNLATTRGQVLRFIVVGGTNTVLTSAAFYLLAIVLPVMLAFTVVYLSGLAFVIVVTPRYVFGSSTSRKRRLLLALWYLGTYGAGNGMISLLTSEFSASRGLVVIVTVMVTAPLSFIGAKLLVGGRGWRSEGRSST